MLRILAKGWRGWLKFAHILGNIQISIFLTLVYWILFPLWAIPYRLFSDRLALRNPDRARWMSRVPDPDRMESMRKQG